ncbi:hypothetical protein AS594_05405 [Streptomyces agglomeratus]|uniref:Glutathionylspermidine synthase pre-ATP-grasp-like domain-containing protein n=1 Tax=Streptomyces agglomeratus TaxID=285458 RepID=A0A1E5P380_9ACTN|nr:hypothetical protein [Streptomyces agglomeratus]OEJ23995.1 hypothetical protein AS594_05405 [Streptomyces agglomeratus]OEJ54489.1 hypothetical protein BGK72_30480 [Streptomyces agglomeratus]
MEHTSTAAQGTAAPALYATDPRLLLNAFDHQFRGFRSFWFDRIAPAGPVVRPAAQGEELERASAYLAGLLRRAVRSLGGDCVTRHRALGLDERLTDFYADEEFENTYATVMGRPDVILTESGWKFIEFNFCSSTGGQVYAHLLNELWRQLLPDTALATLTLADPLKARGDMLRTVLEDLGLDPYVALVGYLPDVFLTDTGGSRRYYEIEVDSLRKSGIRAEYFDTDEFIEALGTRRGEFPLVLERTVPQEWIDAGRGLDPLLRIRKCGSAVLTPQSSYQAANKQLFALLSKGQEWMTDRDRAFVQQYIPWSRGTREETVEFEGESWKLDELLRERRADFVLKRSDGDQNFDVHIGSRTDASAWEDVIVKARTAGTWIAQEAVHSTEMHADVFDCDRGEYLGISTRAVFGPLFMGGRMTGCVVRYDVPAPGNAAPGTAGSSILGSVGWYAD